MRVDISVGRRAALATELGQLGMGGDTDKPEQRQDDPDDDAGQDPDQQVATMATIAIQKSKRCTRARRRISPTSIMPITTASMIRAASTGLGKPENSGARNSRASRTVTPETIDARPVLAPEWSFNELAERLVDTGIPWNSPAPMFASACATDSWLMSIW